MARRCAALVAATTLALSCPPARGDVLDRNVRVSVSSTGAQSSEVEPDYLDERPAVSSDGRFVAFTSTAPGLVPGDTNGVADVFVRDRDADEDGEFDEPGAVTTERVSVSSTGAQAELRSEHPSISADGFTVAFWSEAAAFGGSSSPVIYRDRRTGITREVPVSAPSGRPVVSGDGRHIAFTSSLPWGCCSVQSWVFAFDRDGDRDGAFDEEGAVSLTQIAPANASRWASLDREAPEIAMSHDGRSLAWMDWDVIVRDRDVDGDGALDEAGETSDLRASAPLLGVSEFGARDPALSADGRYVAFSSASRNLLPEINMCQTNAGPYACTHVYVRDLLLGSIFRVSVSSTGIEGNGHSHGPSLTDDGRCVVFASTSSNLDTGVGPWTPIGGPSYLLPVSLYVHNVLTGRTSRVGWTADHLPARAHVGEISGDGWSVAFHSREGSLVPGDTNGGDDYFVRAAADPPGALCAGER